MPELLRRNKLSQSSLAKRLGTSEAFVSQIISGKKHFSYLMALKASLILNCQMEDLYEWVDE
ncbi:helix-turn-helix transcriptional regulator [Paenibacillus illinoisensis]|uniref:helix-turn-helix transcriptional regulator n=1 Tax=Paenibacillus illinoisensis TaxID=59845 RepID=UPI00203D7FA2|nr:helix-turn-helix transcriptional regulator [Paenibacillus illinoisensis]MCM3208478.1 helix-turn-helix domain-containing protein [Paenibacillus illinoisensis]